MRCIECGFFTPQWKENFSLSCFFFLFLFSWSLAFLVFSLERQPPCPLCGFYSAFFRRWVQALFISNHSPETEKKRKEKKGTFSSGNRVQSNTFRHRDGISEIESLDVNGSDLTLDISAVLSLGPSPWTCWWLVCDQRLPVGHHLHHLLASKVWNSYWRPNPICQYQSMWCCALCTLYFALRSIYRLTDWLWQLKSHGHSVRSMYVDLPPLILLWAEASVSVVNCHLSAAKIMTRMMASILHIKIQSFSWSHAAVRGVRTYLRISYFSAIPCSLPPGLLLPFLSFVCDIKGCSDSVFWP